MPIHVFVDETKSRGLLMAAARCAADEVAVNRKALRGLLLPGQERLHFNNETDARRKQILRVIADFHMLVDIYRAERETLGNRRRLLEAIVRDSAGEADRLVIERDDSTYDYDRGTLHAACHRFKYSTFVGNCWRRSWIRSSGCRMASPGRGLEADIGGGWLSPSAN